MKLFRRSLALLLVLCFMATVFVGCGKKSESEAGVSGESGDTANSDVQATETQRETNEYGEIGRAHV